MIIYTDGSCRANGSPDAPGGYGVVAIDGDKIFTYAHQEVGTTNNRQEMKAILYALLNFGDKEFAPTVYTDSGYAFNTFTDWMYIWEMRGWRKGNQEVPENLDLIKAYFEYEREGYKINLKKVKGHSGNKWNEYADGLATGRIQPTFKWEKMNE
jgi:ribonuclease HI